MHHAGVLRSLARKDDYVRAVARDPETAELVSRERAIVDYALKLTRTPGEMVESDLDPLRAEGLDDAAVVNLADTVAYFNYVNRLADGLGVELEPGCWDPFDGETPSFMKE